MKFPLFPVPGSSHDRTNTPELLTVDQLASREPDLLAKCITMSMGDAQALLDLTVKRQFGESSTLLSRIGAAGYIVTEVTVYDDTPETVQVTLPWCVADEQVVLPHVTQPLATIQYLMRDPRFASTVNIDSIKRRKSQAMRQSILTAIPSVSSIFANTKGASILTAIPTLLPMLSSFNGQQQQLRVRFNTRFALIGDTTDTVGAVLQDGPLRVLMDALTSPVSAAMSVIDPRELVMDPSIIGAVSQAFKEIHRTNHDDDDDDVYHRESRRMRGSGKGNFSAD